MAEVHEVHEVHEVEVPVEKRRRGFLLPLIMFLVGGAIIAAVVVAVLNVQSTISWPAGQVSLGPSTTVANVGNAESPPPASVTAETVPPVTESVTPQASSVPVENAPPPPTTDDTTNTTSAAPTDTTPTPEQE